MSKTYLTLKSWTQIQYVQKLHILPRMANRTKTNNQKSI
jgi:hypothetical protein